MRAVVMSLGAATYVDYSRPGWTLEVVEATGGTGVDLVFDGVGGDIGAQALTTLRPGGRISIHGMASGSWTEPPAGVTVIAGNAPTPEQMRALAAEAIAHAAAGRLRPIIGQTYPLGEAAAAHQAIEDRETVGKTLLVP